MQTILKKALLMAVPATHKYLLCALSLWGRIMENKLSSGQLGSSDAQGLGFRV